MTKTWLSVPVTAAILGGVFALSSSSLAKDPDDVPYMDDRSTPEALIQSYYNAITRRSYAQAYSYFHHPDKPFADWQKGYEDTLSVEVLTGSTEPDPGAGQIYWALPVAIQSTTKDGKVTVYAGCYTIHLTNPGMDVAPPFQPMQIESGSLSVSDKAFKDAVPKTCDR